MSSSNFPPPPAYNSTVDLNNVPSVDKTEISHSEEVKKVSSCNCHLCVTGCTTAKDEQGNNYCTAYICCVCNVAYDTKSGCSGNACVIS
jgi:hypothetical protein